MSPFSRRRFLGGMAAGAALAMSPFRVKAQAAKPKLLIYATQTGPLVGPEGNSRLGYGGWLPRELHGVDNGRHEVANGELPDLFSPLQRHAEDILFIDGLRGSNYGAHQQPPIMLNGGRILNDEPPRAGGGDGEFFANTASIDHVVANELGSRVLGLSYAIPGFNLAEGFVSHTSSGNPFIPIQDAARAHDRVFGDLGGDSNIDRRRAVLAALTRETSRVRDSLPLGDHGVLNAHAQQLGAFSADLSSAGMACTAPPAPGDYDARNPANLPRLMRDFGKTMVQAMACDYTQVGFIQQGNLSGSGVFPRWDGLNSNYNLHAIAHKFVDMDGAGSDGLSQRDAIRLHLATQETTWTVFAELLDDLKNTVDVDGSRMLDNTIVLQVCPMSFNHNRQRLVWMVAGGKNLGIDTGRFIRLALSNDTQGQRYVNDLLVSVVQKMGVSIDRIGVADQNTGALNLG